MVFLCFVGRGTQGRFPPKYMYTENTFQAVQSTFRALEMHSKWLYTLFFYKNIFYKNIEARICEILRKLHTVIFRELF